MKLTRANLVGPWAGLPLPWTEHDEIDEQRYRADVARCCAAGMPGVYSGGTTGEFYAMDFEEFKVVAEATVSECRAQNVPAMVGCTSTYTRGACRRAAHAAEIGADAIQVALPCWMAVADDQIVPFFRQVAAAADGLVLSVYETLRTKKALTVDQHREIKDAVPSYLMVKANDGTVGVTPEGCAALSEFVNVFVGETAWPELGPHGAIGCCSACVYWNPRETLGLWELLRTRRWDALRDAAGPLTALHGFLGQHFAPRGFTDTAYDHLGGTAFGFLECGLRSRGPYVSATDRDVAELRGWCREHYPQMLVL